MLKALVNKQVICEIKHRNINEWIEFVGELVYYIDGLQYFLKDWTKFFCSRTKKKVIKTVEDSGTLIMIHRQDMDCGIRTRDAIDWRLKSD